MRSLVYRKSVPKYLLMRFGSKRFAGLETGRFSPLQMEVTEEPKLPAPDWVRVKPLVSGVCGSDLGTLSSENSPYFSPITSPPFTMGHEVVGTVTEEDSGFPGGERVVIEPALGCVVRGIEPMCRFCATGRHALCVNTTKGDIAPGIQTGFCNSTGGGWTDGTLVAHPSQLHRVPEGMPDEAAVAIEPLACAVHAALSARVSSGDTAIVIGAGSVGLLTVAALSRLTDAGRVICVAKYERQRTEALRLGATEVVSPEETYTKIPVMLGTTAMKPPLGKPVVPGGADAVFDCVGSSGTMEDAVRLTKPGGRAVLVGMPGEKTSLDLTALWHKEVALVGAYAYGAEEYRGEATTSFALAMRLAGEIELERLVGPTFRLWEYPEAIKAARSSGRSGNVKVTFDLR
ncbi:MAG: zinc-dependent alcohol dehydrogenase [Rubrobacter sp.]